MGKLVKIKKSIRVLLMIICASLAVISSVANAATYNLTSGSYPPCNTSWSVSGTTYTCNGNGRVTLATNDIVIASTNVTIVANNGFSLAGNTTIGSSGARINLTSSYGTITASGTTTVHGAVNGGSGDITLTNTTINGTLSTSGTISLTGGGVTGLVTSTNNTITTNGTNLSGGARAQSGMTITGGTIAGNFVMTSNNLMTMTGVVMTSGSISGASIVTIEGGSVLGSGSSSISVSSNSGAINVNNSIVYGNLTAPNYSTVNVTNGSAVYGNCSPNSTPANACNATPPPPLNCPAGVSSGITGIYYNNRTLAEPSVASRSDAPIDFNWGAAAPGPSGVNADNFSVRWSGYVRVTQSGNYRFQTVSDDGVRLYVNGNLVINRWNDHSATTDTTTDIPLVAGNTYTIVLEYYEAVGDAVIRLHWRLPGATSYVAIPGGPLPTMGAGLYECAPVANPPITSCATTLTAGITGNYFNNQSLTAPVTSRRSDGPINFDWGVGVPGPTGIGADNFSVRWDGYIRVTQSGVHRFQTVSDDGIRLTVNGVLLIDQWNDHSATTHTSAAVNLVAGNNYPIRLEYYENGGSAVAQLLWQTPGNGSYVAIPRGSSPVSAAGLYECVTTPASYLITHNATGITCAAEAVTVSARNASGAVYNPPAGTVVTLSTAPATGAWVGGNTFTFTGNESGFTRFLRQTSPGALTIRAESATASNTSPITFVDTVFRIALNSALANIPAQLAGINGNAIAKVISTNPKTGVCEARVASRTLPVGLGFSCNNPTSCIAGQSFTVNGSSITANNNAAPVAYNDVNLAFDANGEAPITINYSDVGQLTLHGRLRIPESGNDPEITLSTSSNAFVVKPFALAVSAVTRANGTNNPAGTNGSGSANQFVAAGEPFRVFVEARNGLGNRTPNFGNELIPETINLKVRANSLVHPVGGTLTNLTVNGSIAATAPAGTFVNADVRWNQVGSISILPYFDDSNAATTDDGDYLGAGNIPNFIPSGTVGRFYPDRFVLTSSTLSNSCGSFSYMSQPLTLTYIVEARSTDNTIPSNYGDNYGTMPAITYVAENADSGVNLARFSDGVATRVWSGGALPFNSSLAIFSRSMPNGVPDGPFENLQVGLQLTDTFDSRSLHGLNMNASTTGICAGVGCTAISVGSPLNIRYGRLRLDNAFGPETANLPVNFVTEYWLANRFVPNLNDGCTTILRSAVTYPAGNILTPANLTVGLSGGSTTGNYGGLSATQIAFTNGNASHFFSAPTGGGTGSFNVTVNLTSHPWLRFDWNQDGNHSDSSLPQAQFGFGSYRGHDRVIYWRERFN